MEQKKILNFAYISTQYQYFFTQIKDNYYREKS